MKIYNNFIKDCFQMLESYKGTLIDTLAGQDRWTDVGNYNFIFQNDMAYELGGDEMPAVSGIGFTSDKELVGEDEIWLYGEDLKDIKENTPYARLTFIRVEEGSLGADDKAYSAINKIEHTRYKINPKGYMMRISVINSREPVRVGKNELKEGLNFAKVGRLFLNGYHSDKRVKAVKIIFITLKNFPYEDLMVQVKKSDGITKALDHIYRNIKMDCSACNLKDICNEVDELREMHFNQGN